MKTAKAYFDMGYTAFIQGLSKEANPLLFSKGWPHEAWNLGYEFGELERNAPNQSEAVLQRVPANPFEQGSNSHIRGIAFEDCPYGEGGDKIAWQAGWISRVEANEENPLGAAKGCFNAVKAMALTAVVIALLWALVTHWPLASKSQAECQRNNPPWKTAECR